MTSEGMKVPEIPEDLRELYAMCDEWTKPMTDLQAGLLTMQEIGSPKNIRPLIERIAKAESERDRMREALEELAAENARVLAFVSNDEWEQAEGRVLSRVKFAHSFEVVNELIAARAALSEAPKEGR